jgi:single-stranded-DNA-specific exonuclease
VAVVSVLGSTATGSVRSMPNIHAAYALEAGHSLLHRYGGHAAAAGFSIDTRRLPELEKALCDYVEAHGGDASLVPEDAVDAVIEPRALDLRLIGELRRLEPCGKDNESPRLVLRGSPSDLRTMKDKHLSFRVGSVRCVWWNAADKQDLLSGASHFLGRPSINEFGGRVSAELVVDDVA